eukprot:scaffold231186_cov33-Tisochrysis_lutea.AAC.2
MLSRRPKCIPHIKVVQSEVAPARNPWTRDAARDSRRRGMKRSRSEWQSTLLQETRSKIYHAADW